jgi:hypothetical protein
MVRGGGDPWETEGQRWRHRGVRNHLGVALVGAQKGRRGRESSAGREPRRELRVEAHRLQAWRDEFLVGGIEGLKARPLQPEDRKLKEAERKVGELTMELEIWLAAARKGGFRSRHGSGRDSRGARLPAQARVRRSRRQSAGLTATRPVALAPRARKDPWRQTWTSHHPLTGPRALGLLEEVFGAPENGR